MKPSSPWTIRNLAIEQDLPGLLALYALIEEHDQAGNHMDEATLRKQLAQPGHDAARDRWVACLPQNGEIIGYSLAWLLGNAAVLYTAVHPTHRRQGLGSQLMGAASARAVADGAKGAMIYATDRQTAGAAFLAHLGCQPVGVYTEMRASLEGKPRPTHWPPGLRLKSYREVQQIEQLTAAMNQAYHGLAGHNEVDTQEMATFLAEFNQDGLFLLMGPDGSPVGISRVEPSAERTQKNGLPTGYIDAPGLYPPFRRLALYRAFLRAGMNWLKAQGMQQVELESWGDAPEVLAMYADEGFAILRTITTYMRRLS